MHLPDKVYDVLKWVALILLPAIGVLYASLAEAWGLPYPMQIGLTVNAVALFIGAVIGVSTVAYRNRADS